MSFDFDGLRSSIRDAVRPFVQAAMEQQSENGLYTFYFCTINACEQILTKCNTDKNLREQCGVDPNATIRPMWENELDSPDFDEFDEYWEQRWNDNEWPEVEIDSTAGWLELDQQWDQFNEAFPSGDQSFSGAAFAALILALLDLDREGLFGTGNDRESITLYCCSPDGDPEWFAFESARLNSESSALEFEKQWCRYTGNEPEEPSGAAYDTFLSWVDRGE